MKPYIVPKIGSRRWQFEIIRALKSGKVKITARKNMELSEDSDIRKAQEFLATLKLSTTLPDKS